MTCEPILIAAPTRCGTTMLAWLLHLHGVWIGGATPTQAPETNPQVGTENDDLVAFMRSGNENFRDGVLKRVKTDGPWLFKSAWVLLYRKRWMGAFPNARWLCPQRPVEDIVRSKCQHPGMKHRPEHHRNITKQHFEMQADILASAKFAHAVDMDKVCRGDEAEAREAIEFCGLTFDPKIYRSWVQPERWHGKKRKRHNA